MIHGSNNKIYNILESVTINEADVLFSVNKIKSKLSLWPDNLPLLMFKLLIYCLCKTSEFV